MEHAGLCDQIMYPLSAYDADALHYFQQTPNARSLVTNEPIMKKLFSAVARSATLLRQFGTLPADLTDTCFYLVLNAASKCIFTNFHSRLSHEQCPRLHVIHFFKLTWRITSCVID